MAKQTVIFAETLYNGRTVRNRVSVVIEGDTIVDIVGKKLRSVAQGVVTPGFIDAHSHIGMVRSGEPGREEESNDHLDQLLPLNNPLNSVYFDDAAFREAVEFGVLYSCLVPGSGNLVGGKAMVIRNFAANRQTALVKDYGYKMALGFNPRSTIEWKGSRPNTRMGVYGLLEKKFDQVLLKKEKAILAESRKLKELEQKAVEKKMARSLVEAEKTLIKKEHTLELDSEDKAFLEILSGQRTAKVHVHKEDDVLYLIEIARKYNIRVTADHVCDVHHQEIFDLLGENNIPVVYGPLGSLPYKVELKNESYKNARLLMASSAFYGLMTDHPVIMTPMLRDTLKYFLIAGMKPGAAIGLITLKNAKILGLDKTLGSVEPGKLASLVVWDHDPLHLSSFPRQVIAEGRVLS